MSKTYKDGKDAKNKRTQPPKWARKPNKRKELIDKIDDGWRREGL